MIPPAPGRPRTHRRHSSTTVRLARTMYGDGDAWTPTQIMRYLAGQGIDVSLNTVRLWVIPGLAAAQRAQNQRAYALRQARAHGEPPPASASATPLLDRMVALHAAGLGFGTVAIVVRVDTGLDLTRAQVRYYVQAGREPRLPKAKAAA